MLWKHQSICSILLLVYCCVLFVISLFWFSLVCLWIGSIILSVYICWNRYLNFILCILKLYSSLSYLIYLCSEYKWLQFLISWSKLWMKKSILNRVKNETTGSQLWGVGYVELDCSPLSIVTFGRTRTHHLSVWWIICLQEGRLMILLAIYHGLGYIYAWPVGCFNVLFRIRVCVLTLLIMDYVLIFKMSCFSSLIH